MCVCMCIKILNWTFIHACKQQIKYVTISIHISILTTQNTPSLIVNVIIITVHIHIEWTNRKGRATRFWEIEWEREKSDFEHTKYTYKSKLLSISIIER